MLDSNAIIHRAFEIGTAIPAFNIPYLPMMAPVVEALRDADCVGFITVARLEWIKFQSQSLEAIREQYERVKDEKYTRLHLDHVPVIDEDDKQVDYEEIIQRALDAGYDSVMVDASRLKLDENIAATRRIVKRAHAKNIPVEAELGAVMGHEEGPLPPYEELFASGKGFTNPDEAARFVRETEVDWLSVAIGNVHGAISKAAKSQKKIAARLNIEHLSTLRERIGKPLVLHGGTGIPQEYILQGIRNGIAKINIATAIRQPYEAAMYGSSQKACKDVYDAALQVIRNDLQLEGTAARIDIN